MCLLCRTMRKPAFCNALTASRWFIPGIFGIVKWRLQPL
jgi:hypothetical protein